MNAPLAKLANTSPKQANTRDPGELFGPLGCKRLQVIGLCWFLRWWRNPSHQTIAKNFFRGRAASRANRKWLAQRYGGTEKQAWKTRRTQRDWNS